MERIQKNSIAAASSIGCLSRRLGDGRPPSDAFIGDYSIGTMMSSMGCPTTPSADKPIPSKVLRPMPGTDYDYQPGTYTIATHGSSDFSGCCDCVAMVLPASIWEKSSDPEEVERELKDAFSMVDADGSGEIDARELRGLAKMLGMRMSDKDIQQAMSEMDEDGSGEVTLAPPLANCFCGVVLIMRALKLPLFCTNIGVAASNHCIRWTLMSLQRGGQPSKVKVGNGSSTCLPRSAKPGDGQSV